MPDLPPLEISVQETQRLLVAEGVDLRLIDVRDPEEFAHCRIPRGELIPLSTLPTEAAAKLPDKAAQVLLYCHHGMRSARAADYLRQMGYTNARSVAGGIDRWSREIDPTTPTY